MSSVAALRAEVATTLWYHTMELAPGVMTPGWFDLRPIVDTLPWPDVRGKRCLDVGTYDGFLAFELERRGAAEVVAVDLDDHREWDWPARWRARGPEQLSKLAGPEKGVGFRIAAKALGSDVRRVGMSVYRLNEAEQGRFDVVVCGSLLLHLRDPIAALEAIRSVCAGELLSSECIDLRLTLLHPRTPYARLDGTSELCQRWTPNAAGHAQMLESAGFDVVERGRPYADPFGPGHPTAGRGLRARAVSTVRRARLGNDGVAHAAILARPAG
ncbi:MAG: tRNA (mo5U34)-methyltransferase [Acidimicrobiaceae bacterium]